MIVKSSSSGLNGWSRLSGFLNCSALAAENRIRASSGQILPLPQEDIDEKKGNKPNPLLVGSLYGDLVQSYVRGNPAAADEPLFWDYGIENVANQDLQKTHPASVKEALRLYVAYTKEYPPNHLGTHVATEFPITIPGEVFGLPFDISGSIDYVSHSGGGIVINDFKTESAEQANLKDKFSIREQLWIYALGYELATGEKPIACKIDCCIKTKDPKFRIYPYEPMTERRMKWLRHQVTRAYREMQNPQPNPSVHNCNPWGNPCLYLQNGMCSLI